MQLNTAVVVGLALIAGVGGRAVSAQDEEFGAVNIGDRYVLQSEILGEERGFFISLPASYHDSQLSSQAYPVLYLLDGASHFAPTASLVRFMGAGPNANLQIPELIVVAIPSVDLSTRTRDLSPTNQAINPETGEEMPLFRVSGGADRFLDFLESELIPHVEDTFRTKPYRVLVGHSLGGLFALHALLERPALFQGYVALDPSVWWDDEVLRRRLQDRGDLEPSRPTSIYLALANNRAGSPEPEPINEVPVRAFAETLRARSAPPLRSSLTYFEDENHASIPLIGLYRGLRFLFSVYELPGYQVIRANPSLVTEHFERVSATLGVALLPPEPWVDRMGNGLLFEGHVDAGLELLELNASTFDDSPRALNSFAAALAAHGEAERAVELYEAVLRLDADNETALEALAQLR